MTGSRVFLDTNVLVYAADPRFPARRKTARKLMTSLKEQSDRQGVVSTQVLQEFYIVATTKLDLPPQAAKAAIHALGHYDVVTITAGLIAEAIDCSIVSQLSFWDALIVSAAESACCETLVTEDLQAGQVLRGVRIVNPFEAPSRP